MRHLCVLLLAAVACGKGSKENRKVCEQAAEKFTSCIGDILGPEMAAQARAKDGVDACARDDKTVAMYRTCLPKTDCGDFMQCMEDYALNAQPAIPADKPRVEQCAQHVKDGLRGIAMQVVLLGEHARRNAGDRDHAQRCTLDESKPWESCLEPAEIEEVKRYGAQRQKECEAWPEPLAACILRLPGAKDCNPDEYPLWRLPLEEGPAGPRVAWTLPVADDDDHNDDVRFAWVGERRLVVRDDSSLRVMRDGKALWQAAIAGVDAELVVTGNWIAARGVDDTRGVRLFDLATGAVTTAMAGKYVSRIDAAANDRVLAWNSNYDDELGTVEELHELTPATCAKPKQKQCPRRVAVFEDDGSMYVRTTAMSRDSIIIGTSDGVLVTDRNAKRRLAIHVENNDVVLAGDEAVIADDSGIVILSLSRCRALAAELYLPSTIRTGGERPDDCPQCVLARGDCVVARRRVSWAATVDPHVLPDGTVAFNDQGITEKTHFFGANENGWEVQTNARGLVAGDGEYVYTVSTGLDGDGPFRLLALARENGKVAWQTELPAPRKPASYVRVTTRDGMIAVRIEGTIYVVELAREL